VKVALASDEPPNYKRAQLGSLVDGYEPRIRELVTAFPRMSMPPVRSPSATSGSPMSSCRSGLARRAARGCYRC
jgi:hypothetical protein